MKGTELTDETLKVDLLPCPFCGGNAAREDIPEHNGIGEMNPNAGASYITCKKCWCSTRLEFGRKENLVSAWNTRAAPPPAGGDVEGMRSALLYIAETSEDAHISRKAFEALGIIANGQGEK